MEILWGILLVLVGLFFLISSLLKSDFIVYRILTARSKVLWSKNVHTFYMVVGCIIMVFGVLMAIGIFV